MAYPKILQRLFENSGAGPRLRKEILPFGSTPGTACEGNDARLSNARVPEMHKETHQMGGADALTPEDIGAHPADGMASAGKAGIARLSSAVDMDSEDQAATPKAVKTAYDLASTANTTANTANATANTANATADAAKTTAAAAKANADKVPGIVTRVAAVEERFESNGRVKAANLPLYSGVDSTAQDVAASCKAVKTAYDKAVEAAGAASTPATPDKLGVVRTGANIVNSSGTISVADASATVKSVVQLSSAVNSTSETLAATAKAVKTAYDKALAAQNAAAASGPSYDPATGQVACPGYVGEFKTFMLAVPPLGWAVRNGAVLTQADSRYPQLWAALLSGGMAFLKKTLEQWNALSAAAGGVGGVPFFWVNTTTKEVKLPDSRGDYERGAGSSYLETVGAWHPDAIRDVTGTIYSWGGGASGVFSRGGNTTSLVSGGNQGVYMKTFQEARVVPTAAENRTRAFATLACVYIGGN